MPWLGLTAYYRALYALVTVLETEQLCSLTKFTGIIFLRLKKMAQNEPQGQHRAALAARDANRNGVDNILTRTGIRDLNACYESVTYQDYHECKPLHEIHRKHSKLQNPKTMQETVEMATELMDKRVSTIAERQAENKRKFENTSRNNQNQQQQNKRQNTDRAYTAGSGDKKQYGGSRPLCSRVQGHFKKECPKLKNNKGNRGNQDGRDTALAKVYAVGCARTNPDSNIVTGTMDWLAKYQAIIVCAEKIVRIPWGNETLIVHRDESNQGHESRLHIISYSKIQEYILKGCPVFLAHVTTKEVEDKSEKKRLEDVPIVQDFPKVFPEDLPGLPLTRQVEF
ncbi:hypothetical protein Tco_0454114 [Tanacetum coccineum]